MFIASRDILLQSVFFSFYSEHPKVSSATITEVVTLYQDLRLLSLF